MLGGAFMCKTINSNPKLLRRDATLTPVQGLRKSYTCVAEIENLSKV